MTNQCRACFTLKCLSTVRTRCRNSVPNGSKISFGSPTDRPTDRLTENRAGEGGGLAGRATNRVMAAIKTPLSFLPSFSCSRAATKADERGFFRHLCYHTIYPSERASANERTNELMQNGARPFAPRKRTAEDECTRNQLSTSVTSSVATL